MTAVNNSLYMLAPRNIDGMKENLRRDKKGGAGSKSGLSMVDSFKFSNRVDSA